MKRSIFQKLNKSRSGKLLFLVLICVLLLGAMNQSPWEGTSIRFGAGTQSHEENPWVLRQGEKILDSALQLPAFLQLESGQVYTLTSTVTYDGSRDQSPYAYVHVDHMYCRISINDRVLFSCMPEDIQKWDRSKSPGFIFKAFPVPEDCLGQQITMEVIPALTVPMDYGLPELRFGDLTTNLHGVILRDVPHDVVIVLCVLLGMGAIVFAAVVLKGSACREEMHIGIFSLLFSLYMMTECDLNVYFIGNPYYLYLLNFCTFLLLPVSFLCFMRERLPDRCRKLCTGLITAGLVFAAGKLVLHFAGILDLRELILLVHLMYFIVIVMTVILIRTIPERRKKRYLIAQLIPVLVGVILDGIVYWLHLEVGVNDATFTILGVVVMLLIEIVRMIHPSIVVYTESVQSAVYHKMAYVDELTGVGNRRDYDREIEKIISGEQSFRCISVVSVDLNDLKVVNDQLGHGAGDALIHGAASILSKAAGENGRTFRTGGDEFVLFLYDTDEEAYEAIYHRWEEEIAEFNAVHDFCMSLAIGCERIEDNAILEAVRTADTRMYQDKARRKGAVREK